MPEITPDQVGGATVWFTSQAGITATVLAFVCIGLCCGLVWAVRTCRASLKDANDAWVKAISEMEVRWGARMDQFRGDVKEAFNQNDSIADKVVEALNGLKLEIARRSGRRGD